MSINDALGLAHAHWNAGQADQAELLCQRVLQAWPGQPDALHLLGLMAHAYGNLDMAIAQLRQACAAPRAPAVYFSNLAEMCRQKGLLVEAEAAGRRAVSMNNTLAGAWNNLGIVLQEAGKFAESRSCLERCLQLSPDDPAVLNNLGNTCKRLGLPTQAEQNWLRALALRPGYAEPHSNLAHLLAEQGEHDRAAEHAERAIEINPQMADAYVNMAMVEAGRGRHAEALRWLDAMLPFAPMHAAGLAARAAALLELDRPEEALDSAQRAVAVGPENAEAQNALGMALQGLGRAEPALAAFAQAARLPGAIQDKALVNRAVLLMELGRTEEARSGFVEAQARFPNAAGAWYNGAELHRFTRDDPAIAHLESLLGPAIELSRNDRMLLHFALGKAFLETDDSYRAFYHMGEGNRMKRAQVTFDSAGTSQWLASIATTFTPALLAEKAGLGATSALPVFVLGMPRSGTTLVEQILASHRSVHGAGELSHFQQLSDALLAPLGGYPGAVPGLGAAELRQLGEAYLAKVQPLAQGRRHVVDKMPGNFLHAGFIRLALPGARIIHCVRDPVDTCLSCYSKLFTREQPFTYDLGELGEFHRAYQGLMAHWREVLPASHFLEVRYEDVVADLEGQARRMLEFLSLPWDAAVLEFHRTRRSVRTASVNQVRQPVYASSAGRWRRYAEHLGPLLDALGQPAA